MTFAHQLKTARTRARIPQSELAAILGVTANTVRNWEKGFTEPPEQDLSKKGILAAIEENLKCRLDSKQKQK